MSATRSLNKTESSTNYPTPAFGSWTTPFRSLTADDTTPGVVPSSQRLVLNTSQMGPNARFCDNRIVVLINAAASAVVVNLWVLNPDDNVWYFVASQTTTQARQMLTFKDLPALSYVLVLTNTGASAMAPVTVSGGITS